MTSTEDLTADLAALDYTIMSEAELASVLVELGWTKVVAAPITVMLNDYSEGEFVEVMDLRQGDFVPGKVYQTGLGSISVNTERGPITVASNKMIRKPVK